MLTHRVIWVGRQANDPFLAAAADYEQRLRRLAHIDCCLVRPSDAAKQARAMQALLLPQSQVVALDANGTEHTSASLCAAFRQALPHGRFTYLIGGADGLPPQARALASWCFSLSRLTLPHRAVLAVWLEQLLRAHKTMANERYDR